MTDVQMTAGVTLGDQFETVHYPGDEIRLRVTRGGNVQVVEYILTDREGPPPHSHAWHEYDGLARDLAALYATGQADPPSVVEIAMRHGLRLEGDNS